MSPNLNWLMGSWAAVDLGPKRTGWDETSDMCLACEELEAWASWFDWRTGEDGVLKTPLAEAEGSGLSKSSMLRIGG